MATCGQYDHIGPILDNAHIELSSQEVLLDNASLREIGKTIMEMDTLLRVLIFPS